MGGRAAGSVLGALIAWFVRVPQPVVAGVMAFGAGVFVSTLVPESIVLGVSVAAGATFSVPIFAAIAVSNLPEGLSSSSGVKASKRSAAYVFGVWGGIALISGVAALLGFLLFADASGSTVAFVTTIAAGAIFAMLANTMIPEAFEGDHTLTGLVAAIGFSRRSCCTTSDDTRPCRSFVNTCPTEPGTGRLEACPPRYR